MLQVRNLFVGYGDATAIWDISLEVAEGTIVTVIGPNGAGKSTMINAIAGILPSRSGNVQMLGTDLSNVPSYQYCDHGIAIIPEGRRLFVGMTVEENLEMGCYRLAARELRDESLRDVYQRFPILNQKRNQLAGELSGGQQQMVAIGRALMARPRLMLFDEPSLGLAPLIVNNVVDIIRDIRLEGVSVLLVEQNVRQSMNIADSAYVLEHGHIVASGEPSELLAQDHIQKAYLGL